MIAWISINYNVKIIHSSSFFIKLNVRYGCFGIQVAISRATDPIKSAVDIEPPAIAGSF